LTLKLACESHQRCGTFIPNLGTLGLWVLELFAMYATDRRTNGRTEKSKPYLPPFYGRWYNNGNFADTFYGVSIRPKYG